MTSVTATSSGAPADAPGAASLPGSNVALAAPMVPAPTSPTPSGPPTSTPTAGVDFVWTAEDSGLGDPIAGIWGSSAGDVWAVGGHSVIHSTGEGRWATVHQDAGAGYHSIFGADGWLFVGGSACANGVCQGGVLVRTSDGGATWTQQALGSDVTGFADSAGTPYADSAQLFGSTDDFATATTVPLTWPTSVGVFGDGGALYAYGGLRGAQIQRSSDGGQTWATVYSGFSGSQSGYINAMARGATTMFALANGCSVPACVGALFRSLDGGTTWQEASRPQDFVAGIFAASDGEILVGGTALMRSVDGGATFTKVALPVDTSIQAIWGASANEVYAVGLDGTVFHGKR